MAKGKKSFVLYSDQKELFEQLPDEQAGKLIKHIYKYVNDENPEADDLLVKVAFASVKASLKRDLDRWEKQLEQRREAGKRSAEVRKKKSTSVNDRSNSFNETTRNSTDNVSVSDNVSVNGNDNKEEKEKRFNFRKSVLELGVDEQVVDDWMKVRNKKKSSNTETAFKRLVKQIDRSGYSANECITKAVERSWSGFDSEWMPKKQGSSTHNSDGSPKFKNVTF